MIVGIEEIKKEINIRIKKRFTSSLGKKLESGRRERKTNAWKRVPDLRELLLTCASSTQENYLTPWMVYGKTVTPVDNDIAKEIPFNPIFWEFETEDGDETEDCDTYLGKLSKGFKSTVGAERAKYMKLNNLYSICLMICMNHEMNYGKDLFLFESSSITKEWYYNYKYQTISDLLENGGKYMDPNDIHGAVDKKEKTEPKDYWDDTLITRYYVNRKYIFRSTEQYNGTLDLNELNHRTVWVAAVFLHKVQEHQEDQTGKCKLQALLDFIPKMQKVLQKFGKEDKRISATNAIVRHKCNLKF